MAKPGHLKILREAVLELAGRRIRAERKGKRMRSVIPDAGSATIEVHGLPPKAEWNGHYAARIYHPRITSIAEAGDRLKGINDRCEAPVRQKIRNLPCQALPPCLRNLFPVKNTGYGRGLPE